MHKVASLRRMDAPNLVFSATLTRNPTKIASLHLHSPTYIALASTEAEDPDADPDADARYVAPATLSEYVILFPSTGAKSLSLLHLLLTFRLKGVLIFCKSVDSAHRLTPSDDDTTRGKRALRRSSRAPPTVAPFSSDLPGADRTSILASLRNGTLTALVCSDLVTRGKDLGSGISTAYVYFIGRTARASREGVAYSLLEEREVRLFKKEVRQIERAEGARVRNMKVAEAGVEGFVGRYRVALEKLGEWSAKAAAASDDDISDCSSGSDSDDDAKPEPETVPASSVARSSAALVARVLNAAAAKIGDRDSVSLCRKLVPMSTARIK
ncbi:P-loop containing nucleoside triphosphate hydrolase protein [Blyttiomyces helicus]|uniref:ATP-dependent RNA helicase n=1 Tax=Blyttiomyces helicus TaxID=388810 RepID=A0A4P9WJR4_9FUNG|nr:P-loop containing nucleoside triphosphate hydrolase protein [Blyttiomyces helicus]|eukprot:RKO92203.1 P-loop containing nucleoside triphosphate hydrolase protein [Blyttiomyces helicus]